ncbi:methyltransferase, FxLD system [Micromonospora aurantiaca]|uniref:methyltransferase, FxLD system n=1 Tax=Micromonospora aurantiaca (nom. illeg.) TaxID=47850 RepID=UPI000F3FCEA9|nr:methyltransferase, FxLD system [Micromonospora aurantiaca]RNH98247.1 methyltransferase, FxLD system [Micromonospora aurantiaca]
MAGSTLDTVSADEARARLVDHLLADGRITSPAVEAAFRRVPRHLFASGDVSIDAAYADDVVITKRGPDGRATSSISAPWLQAMMLHAARLRPGARVLEIGSGGYNAALIAEVVGPHGAVTSIDIDPDVTGHARTALDAAGYPHVQVATADAETGWPADAPYDAVIVTVEVSDIPPAWTDQLAPDGILVVPLRMRGNTRCLTLTREADHLIAIDSIVCGFVPMQGAAADPVTRRALRGDDVTLRIDDPDTRALNLDALSTALNGPRIDAWSAVTTPPATPFDSLHLWLASQPHPYGQLAVDRHRAADLDPQNWVICPALLTDDSITYLATRKLDDTTWQFGARGYGPHAAPLTRHMLDLIAEWDRHYRTTPGPHLAVYPHGTAPAPTNQPRLTVPRHHTTIAITWATAGTHA